MIWRVIKIVLALAVIALLLLWLWGGGFSGVVAFVKTIPNPIDIIWGNSTSTYAIRFPWQLQTPRGPDISGLAQQGDALSGNTPGTTGGGYSSGSDSTDVEAQTKQQAFGSPSQQRGEVSLSAASARASDSRLEYVELTSHSRSAVSLSGWSLQSVLTGTRVYLPPATATFTIATINTVQPVTLLPGETAIVSSGPSPVGVSFKESRCTSYLAQVQTFEPALDNACPASSDLAPLTAENLQHYGNQCMDYARSLPSCSYPTSLPGWMTPGCTAFIQNTFSYQSCVNRLSGSSSFFLSTWRLYLNSSLEFWDNTHDIIRLLDAQGLTVDAVSY
jgi:hypothetical protein